ncbi:MAG: hypothetical protein ACRC7B_01595 [Metamycoplasmataceae bacterium]
MGKKHHIAKKYSTNPCQILIMKIFGAIIKISGVKTKNILLTVKDFRIINPNENGMIKKLIV